MRVSWVHDWPLRNGPGARSTRTSSHIRRAPEFGIRRAEADFDFAGVMERGQRVIREVAPVLEEIGTDQELAAKSLGASGWQAFLRITLPGIKPTIITLVLLAVGRICYSDFGLFYLIPQHSGLLYAVQFLEEQVLAAGHRVLLVLRLALDAVDDVVDQFPDRDDAVRLAATEAIGPAA